MVQAGRWISDLNETWMTGFVKVSIGVGLWVVFASSVVGLIAMLLRRDPSGTAPSYPGSRSAARHAQVGRRPTDAN